MNEFAPKISIVVCTYNRANQLRYVLESLADQTIDKTQFEVLIVDNNSTDHTHIIADSYVARYCNFHLLKEPKQGLSHARNLGYKESRGEYVAYIDDDARACKDWCQRILFAFEAIRPKPLAVGGEIHPWYEGPFPEWFDDSFEIRSWGNSARYLIGEEARNGFSGSNMAFQKKVLVENGGFSVKFGQIGKKLRMGEDTEFFFRICQNVPQFWYDPKIRVYHWTPYRNSKLWYRCLRQREIGCSQRAIHGCRIFSVRTLKLLTKNILLIFELIKSIVFYRKNRKLIVKKIEHFFYLLGYAFG